MYTLVRFDIHFYICIPAEELWGSFTENLFKNNFCKAKKISTFAVPKRGVLKRERREEIKKRVSKQKRVDRGHD